MSDQQNSLTVKINNLDYDIKINFDDGNKMKAEIGYTMINRISIYTNLFDPFFSAELEYIDTEHALEKGANNKDPNINVISKYRYRGDGYDTVIISITPHNNVKNADIISFACVFSVVNAYNKLNKDNTISKILVLEDYTKHILQDKQANFTTSAVGTKYNAQCSNSQRSMTTGTALSALLTNTFGKSVIDNKRWDIGGSNVFYSSSINEKALTTLNKLYNLHISSTDDVNDKCFLSHSIHSDNSWSFISLKDMFQNAVNGGQAGAAYIETIRLENTNDSTSSNGDKYTPDGALFNTQSGYARSYDFRDLQQLDALSLNSHIVYNYNVADKHFIVDMNDGNVDKFKEFYFSNFISKLSGKNVKPYPNVPLTQTKQQNVITTNIFNLYDTDNLYLSRNKLLTISTLLNNSIELNLLGSTIREPGYFIGVTTQTPGGENDYNSKIYGTYLIVSATHVFTNNTYTNKLICSKPYLYNKPEDIKGEIHG